MEELPKDLSIGEVSFQSLHKFSCKVLQSGNSEKMQGRRTHQRLTISNRPPFEFNQSSEIPDSPINAMEFLCRSWSPSASDFLNEFSSSEFLLPLSGSRKILGNHEKEVEKESEMIVHGKAISRKAENIKVDMNQMNGWLKGRSITNFLRSRREKKKEELRFHTAKLHVALSITRLAAAIANFTTHGGGGGVSCDQHMGSAVASAAALVTTVWAETAESMGAQRGEVASAINAGLAVQTPTDMMALTATAATCLRGAATLETRAMAESYFPKGREMLKVGAQICIILPSGQRKCKWVTVNLKRKELILSFPKKYFGGAITTSTEYKAINVIEEPNEGGGNYFLSLKTNKGIIKLLLEDKKQFTIWLSTISKLLKTL